MRFELGLDEPAPGRALRSAITIAFSYVVGGAVPLAPYLLSHVMGDALRISIIITLIALLIFGGLKGRLLGSPVIRSGIQTMLIGGLAAGAAFVLARLLNGHA
jgi:predicted membrane protein (TIGR00267 family)